MSKYEYYREALTGTGPKLAELTLESAIKLMQMSGGNLYLIGTSITTLPEGLTVGGNLYLRGSSITTLPEGLTVGGSLDLSGTSITDTTKVQYLHNGDYVEGRFLFADGILTHIKRKKQVNEYTCFIGKIPGRNVVYDGTHYAHCNRLRDGIADLIFKSARDRGADQYKGISLDKSIPLDEMRTMYRIITGACQQGTQNFIDGLGDKLKSEYTIREVIALTENQYGGSRFSEFFSG